MNESHGYPLFRPPPFDDLPEPYKKTGTRIGDVGVVTEDGYFDVIFNICVPPDDPINRFGVPDGFEPLQLGAGDVRECATHHRPGCDVSSSKISKQRLDVNVSASPNIFAPAGLGATVEVSTSSKTAGILILPDGASRCDVRLRRRFEEYALKHAQRWYSFVNGQVGLGIDTGALYLVTGCDKTTSWNIAAFQDRTDSGRITMKLTASECISAGFSYTWDWQNGSTDFTDSGPRRRPGEEGWSNNQTVFLRGYKVAIRSHVLKKALTITASSIVDAKPSDLLSKPRTAPVSSSVSGVVGGFSSERKPTGVSESEVDTQYIPRVTPPYHPSTAMNNHLLKTVSFRPRDILRS
ncbi:hypothetical protein DFH09DRAFT_1136493 [Mycena vulgaris]|nr:hypothetical protein DFH09DRAFT_1136493 [Mycena vulgaris]